MIQILCSYSGKCHSESVYSSGSLFYFSILKEWQIPWKNTSLKGAQYSFDPVINFWETLAMFHLVNLEMW